MKNSMNRSPVNCPNGGFTWMYHDLPMEISKNLSTQQIALEARHLRYGFDVSRQSLSVSSARFGVAASHSDSYLPSRSWGVTDQWGWGCVVHIVAMRDRM